MSFMQVDEPMLFIQLTAVHASFLPCGLGLSPHAMLWARAIHMGPTQHPHGMNNPPNSQSPAKASRL